MEVNQAGWKFTVVNNERYLVRVGISDLAEASELALRQVKGGRIKKQVQLSALEVEQLNIFNGFSVTQVRSGNESRKVSYAG
jgi:hypothetical protein